MAQKIVGLDIGSYSIKAVVLESTYRGWELIGYHEKKISSGYVETAGMIGTDLHVEEESEVQTDGEQKLEEESIEESSDGEDEKNLDDEEVEGFDPQDERLGLDIQGFIRRYGSDWDSVYTAIDGDSVSLKLLTLPYSEAKQINDTLQFLIEDQVPFPLKDKIIDYQLLHKEPENNRILVALIDETQMGRYLANFEATGKEPKSVIIDSLALGNLADHLLEENQRQEVLALVDLGHRTTSVAIIDKGRLSFTRTFAYGGQDLTRAIAEDFSLDFEDAERTKHLTGFLSSSTLTAVDPDQQAISSTLEKAIEPLVQQLRLTLQAYVSQSREMVSAIHLVGGASKLNNLPDFLSERLAIPVTPLHYLRSEFDRMADSGEVEPEMAAGLGIAFDGLSGSRFKRLNLRKGQFAFKGDFELWKGRIAHIATSLTFIFLFFIISIWSQFRVLGTAEEEYSNSISASCEEILGRSVSDAKICMSSMIEVINKEGSGGSKLTPGVSSLAIYNDLASRMSNEETLLAEIDELEITDKKIKLKGETDALGTVSTIVSNLEDSSCLHNIKQGPTRPNASGTKTKFSLSILVDCTKAAKATREKATSTSPSVPEPEAEKAVDSKLPTEVTHSETKGKPEEAKPPIASPKPSPKSPSVKP